MGRGAGVEEVGESTPSAGARAVARVSSGRSARAVAWARDGSPQIATPAANASSSARLAAPGGAHEEVRPGSHERSHEGSQDGSDDGDDERAERRLLASRTMCSTGMGSARIAARRRSWRRN
jgi:hypothetical protein